MKAGQLFNLGFIFMVKLPLKLAATVLLNIANYIAPGPLFTFLDKRIPPHPMPNPGEFKSTKDMEFLFSLDRVARRVRMEVRDVIKPAQLGEKAPDIELMDLDSRKNSSLLSLARAGRPLVLNFGSCT